VACEDRLTTAVSMVRDGLLLDPAPFFHDFLWNTVRPVVRERALQIWHGCLVAGAGGGGGDSSESFLRVHWVAVPEALRARRVNRRRRRRQCGGWRKSRRRCAAMHSIRAVPR
jgi:hypothetical protein